jgi:4-hydroxybenzoate polyprenyltransferase
VLAGVALAGATATDERLAWIALAMSLCYVAGMYLNDAFDADFDARHRPERPIPSGRASGRTVFAAGVAMLGAGVLLLAMLGFEPGGTGWPPLAAGAALAATIVAYDRWHKDFAAAPVVMGLCRALVYVGAAAVVAAPPAPLYAGAALLLCYLVGLTYVARQEHLGRIEGLWPLGCLAVPVAWGAWAAREDLAVALAWAAFTGWLLYALTFLRRRGPGDVPRAVGHLLAGICLWDALLIATTGRTTLALVAAAAFVLTLLLQRRVAPT